jgi:hypothetical protein
MAGTVAVAVKKAIIDGAAARFADTDVKTSYHYPGDDPQRELIHGDSVSGDQGYPLMRGTGRWPRDETLSVRICIVVTKPGADPYDCELRAVEIGQELEEFIADDPGIAGLDGLISIGVSNIDLDSAYDDDQAVAVLVYDFAVKARIR